jgi:hypothetical protein
MRLADNLRKAEEKGVRTIRRSVDRAREEWADVERRIRQRMRIYPQKQRTVAAGAGTINLDDVAEKAPETRDPRTPIISVNGHDLKQG